VLDTAGLAAWHPTNMRPGQYALSGEVRPSWVAHQGHVAHPAGSTSDVLLFDYPLTGTYDFAVDAYVGPWAGSLLLHNGLGVLPSAVVEQGGAEVLTLGHQEMLVVPWRLSRSHGFNRITVQVTPRKVRYLVNGHLFHEDDDPSPTSPWLGLLTFRERHSAWRNATLRGQPSIPREVRLSHGDRLEGWVSSFYNESRPPRWTEPQANQFGIGTVVRVSSTMSISTRRAQSAGPRARRPKGPVNLDDFDWAAQDGVIHGRRLLAGAPARNTAYYPGAGPTGTEADQSRLYYHRPLRDGDAVAYEFLYEPGQVMVHPSVDRLAFLLGPDGVKVHWMTAGGGDLSGLPADNAVEEPANRRGPQALPLKPGEWNALKLALDGDRVTLELNGQAIYERTMEPALGRQFGLFHYKDQTAAQVRNVVLRGRWPEALTQQQLADLLAPDPAADRSEAARRARHALVGEPIFALQAGALVDQARSLPTVERYRLLVDWVLPSPDHPVCRLEGDFTPSFPAPGAGEPKSKTGTGDEKDPERNRGSRLQTGGAIRAPAIELVDCARELGKLDELAERVGSIPTAAVGDDPAGGRGKLALLALIQIARGDDDAAAQAIAALGPPRDKLPLDQPEWARWPELATAARAATRPALRPKALALLETMARQAASRTPTEEEKRASSRLWEHHVQNLRARVGLLIAAERGEPDAARPFGIDPEVPAWARVTPTRAETRGEGEPIPHWTAREGQLTHLPGHDRDLLYLTVPLRGGFQVDCELTSAPGRQIRVGYGGLWLGPKPDGKQLERSQFGRPLADLTLRPPLGRLAEWYAFRLVVKGNRMTALIDGRKVHEAPTTADGDPWLTLLCSAEQSGAARKLTITGEPQVPEKLDLSAAPDLSGWLADEYGETITGEDPDWDKRGEEIVGRRIEEVPGSRQESLLRYHRPMLEDGRIAYEFYYDPGKVMVHPALDRLAFLLEPDGVKVHRLTDGAHERAGLAADNAREEPDNRRGPASLPLKPKDWNRLVLSLAGDRAKLELNDQVIYDRILESTNQRSFGLFHYADASQVRVRNVSYQGQWPRSLPRALRPHQ
jgi:hypothetical protein